jgi:hypothetical protein
MNGIKKREFIYFCFFYVFLKATYTKCNYKSVQIYLSIMRRIKLLAGQAGVLGQLRAQ